MSVAFDNQPLGASLRFAGKPRASAWRLMPPDGATTNL